MLCSRHQRKHASLDAWRYLSRVWSWHWLAESSPCKAYASTNRMQGARRRRTEMWRKDPRNSEKFREHHDWFIHLREEKWQGCGLRASILYMSRDLRHPVDEQIPKRQWTPSSSGDRRNISISTCVSFHLQWSWKGNWQNAILSCLLVACPMSPWRLGFASDTLDRTGTVGATCVGFDSCGRVDRSTIRPPEICSLESYLRKI